jgi:hypothetical protein
MSNSSAVARPPSFLLASSSSFNQPLDIAQRERSDLSAKILEAKATLDRLQSLKMAQDSLASPIASAAPLPVVSQGMINNR